MNLVELIKQRIYRMKQLLQFSLTAKIITAVYWGGFALIFLKFVFNNFGFTPTIVLDVIFYLLMYALFFSIPYCFLFILIMTIRAMIVSVINSFLGQKVEDYVDVEIISKVQESNTRTVQAGMLGDGVGIKTSVSYGVGCKNLADNDRFVIFDEETFYKVQEGDLVKLAFIDVFDYKKRYLHTNYSYHSHIS